MHKLRHTYELSMLGFRLGATVREKIRLAWFLVYSRINKHAPIVDRRFVITSNSIRVPVYVRNTFADPFILREAFVSHDYDKDLPQKAPGVIFDIGANLGFVTLYFKSRFPQAKIFCFEPDPQNFAQLKKNTTPYSDITCFNVGIGAKEETRHFYRSRVFHMRNSLVLEEGSEQIEIKLISLEDAMRMAGVTHIDLMKFDAEGAEREFVPAFIDFDRVASVVGELHPYLMNAEEYAQVRQKLESFYKLTVDDTDRKRVFFYGSHKN